MQDEYKDNYKDIVETQKNGSKKALENLIERNKGLIWNIVKRFQNRGYELEDLYQIGVIGFIKAIKRFDTSFEVELSTYAVPYILGEIKRFIRDDGLIKVSRGLKELAVKALDIRNQYYEKNGREIKIEKLAKILNTTKEELTLAMDAYRPVDSINQPAYEENDDGMSILDKIDNNENQEERITNKLCIEDALNKLKKQERQIIILRYFKCKTQIEVANMLGITQVQVSRIEKKTLENMKNKLAM